MADGDGGTADDQSQSGETPPPDDVSGTDGSNETEADADPEPEPAAQSEALRRQQLVVASGVATLAGIAVTVAGIQQFPSVPIGLFLLVGMTTTALLFMLLYTSIFPGSEE